MKKKIVLCMLAWNLALGTVAGASEMVSARGVEETYENIKKGTVMDDPEIEYYTADFCEGNYGFKYLKDGTVEIISYKDSEENAEITIPSNVNGKKVTKIREKAFSDSTNLKSVIIPDLEKNRNWLSPMKIK